METTDIDETGLVIGRLLAETARIWRYRLDQRLRHLNLSQSRGVTLLQIYHSNHLRSAGHEITQQELADNLAIEAPTLVRLLDRLQDDQLIERRPDALDRRVKRIHLKEESLEIIQKVETIAKELEKEIVSQIKTSELQQCLKTLKTIKENAHNMS